MTNTIDGLELYTMETERNELYDELNDMLATEEMVITTLENLAREDVDTATIASYLNISTEELSDKERFKNKLGDIYSMFGNIMVKKFKQITLLEGKATAAKINILEKLKEDIKTGKLAKATTISSGSKLKSKLGVMLSMGYDIESSASGLISYINGIANVCLRGGRFSKNILKMFETLTSDKGEPAKQSGVTNMVHMLSAVRLVTERKKPIRDFRFSIPANWIASNPSILFLSKRPMGGFKVHTDKYEVSKELKVKTVNDKITIELIDAAIKIAKDADKYRGGLDFTLRLLNRDMGKTFLSAAGGDKAGNIFLQSNFVNGVNNALINYNKNIYSIPDLAISYVSGGYKAVKKK